MSPDPARGADYVRFMKGTFYLNGASQKWQARVVLLALAEFDTQQEAEDWIARWESNDRAAIRLDPDAPAPPLEGGDWGFAEDLDDGRMSEPSGLGDGAER
jgi:hypothetical protein